MRRGDTELREAWRRGSQRWPSVAVDEARYRTFLEALDVDLSCASAEDLYLTCACAAGDATAIRVFEETFSTRSTPSSASTAASICRTSCNSSSG
jgi:hypothetical protein